MNECTRYERSVTRCDGLSNVKNRQKAEHGMKHVAKGDIVRGRDACQIWSVASNLPGVAHVDASLAT